MSTWSDAFDCARRFAPAEEWRRLLASAVRRASNATFAAVCTCPPGAFVEPSAAADPPAFGRVVEQIIDEFLPKVERAGDGTSVAVLIGPGAYAPLELARDLSLMNRFRREVLEPVGVNGLLNSFLLGRGREVIGWIALGTHAPSPLAMSEISKPLTEVSLLASATLQAAIDLASACGIVPVTTEAQGLIKLTAREREVARLVASGCTNSNIAVQLSMSEQTVGVHLKRIYIKLGVHSRGELASRLGTLLTRQPARVR
ncbi:MAG: helix-turn-helix transcriptional regulator [Myxococcaceae bacterium]